MRRVSVFVLSMSVGLFAQAQTFTLKSSELGGQATSEQFFNGFGCTGENISPILSWENVPAGTQSFAVTLYDKDAPTGSGWWHWLVFDIPRTETGLAPGAGNLSQNLAPAKSVQSRTDYGVAGYGGPCPPEGDPPHQYVITVYALRIGELGLDKTASPALVGYYLEQNVIEKASIVFYAKR